MPVKSVECSSVMTAQELLYVVGLVGEQATVRRDFVPLMPTAVAHPADVPFAGPARHRAGMGGALVTRRAYARTWSIWFHSVPPAGREGVTATGSERRRGGDDEGAPSVSRSVTTGMGLDHDGALPHAGVGVSAIENAPQPALQTAAGEANRHRSTLRRPARTEPVESSVLLQCFTSAPPHGVVPYQVV
jgi:hypothetical protein